MFIFNVTAIYLRCGFLLIKSEELFKKLENYEKKFKYIETKKNIIYKDRIIILFKISYSKIDDFKSSPDYEFIKEQLNAYNNKKEKCFYCGDLTPKKDQLIYELFQNKCAKLFNITEYTIIGIDFLNNNVENSFFNLPKKPASSLISVGEGIENVTKKNYLNLKNNLYPYLLTVGEEGVTVYRVDSINSFKKIGGNSFGPTTLWSLMAISCGYEDPDLALSEAAKGNNRLIDLSVGDIYGGNYDNISLSSDLIGSSFGNFKNVVDMNKIEKKDIAKSLIILYGATYSHVTAMESSKEKIDKIISSGNPFDLLELFQIIQTSIDRYSNNFIGTVFNDYLDYFELIGKAIEIIDNNYNTKI